MTSLNCRVGSSLGPAHRDQGGPSWPTPTQTPAHTFLSRALNCSRSPSPWTRPACQDCLSRHNPPRGLLRRDLPSPVLTRPVHPLCVLPSHLRDSRCRDGRDGRLFFLSQPLHSSTWSPQTNSKWTKQMMARTSKRNQGSVTGSSNCPTTWNSSFRRTPSTRRSQVLRPRKPRRRRRALKPVVGAVHRPRQCGPRLTLSTELWLPAAFLPPEPPSRQTGGRHKGKRRSIFIESRLGDHVPGRHSSQHCMRRTESLPPH